MTAPEQQKEKAAAVGFAVFFSLALGWAGLLVAAAAVGLERAWTGGAVERRRSAQRRGSWLDNQRSWLEQDHRAREARSRAYGSWLNSGADPASRPARPSWWRRLADSMRRRVARTAVAGHDFRTGFRDGWQAADETRRDGGGFRDIAGTRPAQPVPPADSPSDVPVDAPADVCRTCRRHGVPVAYNGFCADCNRSSPAGQASAESSTRPSAKPNSHPAAAPAAARGDNWPRSGNCGKCGTSGRLTPVGWCERCVLAGEHGFCSRCDGLMVRNGDVFRHGPHQGCAAVVPVANKVPFPKPAPKPVPKPGHCGCGQRLIQWLDGGVLFPSCPVCDGVHRSTPKRDSCSNCLQYGYRIQVQPDRGPDLERKTGQFFIHEMTGTTRCPSDEQVRAYEQTRVQDRPGPHPALQQILSENNRRKTKPATPESNAYGLTCSKCGFQSLVGFATRETAVDAANAHKCPTNGGDTMTAPAQTATPVTESNATVLRTQLQTANNTLGQIADLTDKLAAARSELDRQVRAADEFATATGQSAQARTALDESSALAAAMGERLGEFSQGAVGAQEQMTQASDGLRVAENAEDELRSAGADGRAIAPAGANA